MKEVFNNEKGNISIIMCVAIAALFGFLAYVVDIGLVYSNKNSLYNAVDAAVLAGAQELPEDEAKAICKAEEYLLLNGVDPSQVQITIGEDNKSIEINGIKQVNHLFAPILGIDSSEVKASSKAIIGPIKSAAGGIRPFAVEDFSYVFGDLVTLKENAGDGYQGNYGLLALGGTGASVVSYNVMYGYKGKISVGDYVSTEPGNIACIIGDVQNFIRANPESFSNFEKKCERVWTVPLVDSLEVNGRDDVLVTGFAQVFVEDIEKQSGKMEIKARFIRFVTNGEIDLSIEETGLYGVKIVKQ